MNDLKMTLIILLISTIRMSTPITLAAIGGTFSARTGTMALGLEGFMLMGAWGGGFRFLSDAECLSRAAGRNCCGYPVFTALWYLYHSVSCESGNLRNWV